jgi:hypothetical protein
MERYGLYDTEGGVWMGDDDGPKLFEDESLARIAAQMMDVQLGQDPGRTRAKPFDELPKRKRDEVATRMSSEEAISRLENGRLQ